MRKSRLLIAIVALIVGSMAFAQEQITTKDFKAKIWDYNTHKQSIVLKTQQPVILDFYATWCRPCKMLAPELIQIQKDYKGKVLVYKIDIDQEPELASVFGIQSVPTIFFIKTDGQYDGVLGYRTYNELKQVIDSFFFNNKKTK